MWLEPTGGAAGVVEVPADTLDAEADVVKVEEEEEVVRDNEADADDDDDDEAESGVLEEEEELGSVFEPTAEVLAVWSDLDNALSSFIMEVEVPLPLGSVGGSIGGSGPGSCWLESLDDMTTK